MKTYKDFEKSYIGSSDIAAILVSGPSGDGLHAQYISFGEDGAYSAYIVTDPDAEIGSHYQKVADFDYWMTIYDDRERVNVLHADHIEVYRSGMRGCIIRLINAITKE